MGEKERDGPDTLLRAPLLRFTSFISVLSLLILITGIFQFSFTFGFDNNGTIGSVQSTHLWQASNNTTVISPDRNLEIEFYIDDYGTEKDCILYNITIDGGRIIRGSRLGLVFGNNVNKFGSSLSVVNISKQSVNSSYSIAFGEKDLYEERYNSIKIELHETVQSNRTLTLEARVYNEGIAFRYLVGSTNWPSSVVITGELTSFRFQKDYYCYTEYGTEGVYTYESIRNVSKDCESPLTVEIGERKYLSITEGNTTNYSRMYLKRDTSSTHGIKVQLDSSVTRKPEFETPWRVLIYGDYPGQLVENGHILYSLCSPSIVKNTSWIKPGKAFRDCSLTTNGSKEIIDFSVDNGLQYVHLDAGWYGSEWGMTDASKVRVSNLNLTEVIRYGNESGIGVIVYVNEKALKGKIGTLFPLYERWGIKGVKFGFVDGRSQTGINFLHKAIEKAAEHHLIVNIHDNYRPTGLTRTYPNLLTMEGIRGNEHFPYPKHNTILPYTRFTCGPADYTPQFHPKEGVTTYSHQISLPIMYFSPLTYLYWYHKPSGVAGKNGTGLLASIPTVWNETMYLDGIPGSYASVARRSYDDWYWCCLNGPQRRSVKVDLDFLEMGIFYNATFYRDDGNGSVQITNYLMDSNMSIYEDVIGSGGISIRFTPASKNDTENLKNYGPRFNDVRELVCKEDALINFMFVHLNGNDPPSMELVTDADFLEMDAKNGSLVGNPTNSDIGLYNVTVDLKEEFFGLEDFDMKVEIENVNDDPRIITDPVRKVQWNTFYNMTFKAMDIDPTNDTLYWSLSTDADFLTIDASNGSLIGRPFRTRRNSFWINVTVSDGNGGSDHLNYTLAIEGFTDGSPVIVTENLLLAVEDSEYFNDYHCRVSSNLLTINWSMEYGPDFLSIDPDTGELSGTPDDSDIGTWSVNITVKDELDRDDWVNFTLEVMNINDPPVILGDPPSIAVANFEYRFDLSYMDDDPASGGDLHTWTRLSPEFLTIDRTTGTIRGIPSLDDVGEVLLEVRLSDGNGGIDTLSKIIEVRTPTGGPVITIHPPSPLRILEDRTFQFQFKAVGTNGPFTWSMDTSAPFLQLDRTSGLAKAAPGNDDVGEYRVHVNVTDISGKEHQVSFMVEVENVNDPPVMLTEILPEAIEDVPYEVGLVGTDIDPIKDDLIWTIDEGPVFLEIGVNNGVLSGMPSNDDVGSHIVHITVNDQNGGIDSRMFMLSVNGVNDPPAVVDPNLTIVFDEDTSAELDLGSLFIDVDDPYLSYSIAHSTNFTKRINGKTLVLTPINNWNGIENITILGDDGEFSIKNKIVVEVVPVNDAPFLADIEGQRLYMEGTQLFLKGTAQEIDITDGDSLVFRWYVNGYKFLGEGEVISFFLPVGAHNITLIISDKEGASIETTTNVTIIDKSDPPEKEEEKWSDVCFLSLVLILLFMITCQLVMVSRAGNGRKK